MLEQENENKNVDNSIEATTVEETTESEDDKPVLKGPVVSTFPLKQPIPGGGNAVKKLKSFLNGDRGY